MKKLTLTIGIPTYYGGESLVKTVESILKFKNVYDFNIIVSVDGKKLDKQIYNPLKKYGVRIVENITRGGQVARINQIISMCETDIIILTQDDIIFTSSTVDEIMNGFENNPEVTMEAARVVPLKATNLIEKIIQVGVSISFTLGKNWNNGDNYFAAGGRCLAFRTDFAKHFKTPDEVLNSDTYLYFLNQKLGGKFLYVPSAIYRMRSPNKLSDHLKQSKKYQYVPREIMHYLKIDINKTQTLPKSLLIYATLKEFSKNPIITFIYWIIMFYTRIKEKGMYDNVTRFWDTDISTKKI